MTQTKSRFSNELDQNINKNKVIKIKVNDFKQ